MTIVQKIYKQREIWLNKHLKLDNRYIICKLNLTIMLYSLKDKEKRY